MAKRRNTQLLEVRIVEVGQDVLIDRVVDKHLGVLPEAEFLQPACDPVRHHVLTEGCEVTVYRASA